MKNKAENTYKRIDISSVETQNMAENTYERNIDYIKYNKYLNPT